MAARKGRIRANSFRGVEMHEELRGPTEVVGSTTSDGEDELLKGGLKRKDSGRPSKGRYKQTPTVRQAIELRRAELGIIPCGPEPLSHVDMSEFYRLVDFIDNDPAQLSMERSAIAPERRASLERTAIRIFYQLDAKEQKREKLTPKEFELKSVVDDLLVRMLGGAAGGEAAVLTAPSPLPDSKPADDGHAHAPEGDVSPELDYMPGGSLGTKPVYVTPLPAKDVLSAAAASKPAVEDEEPANSETGWPPSAQVDQ